MLKTIHTDTVVAAILRERSRQIGAEGWTPEHDDEHTDGSLSRAAATYALTAAWAIANPDDEARPFNWNLITRVWPISWSRDWLKPKNAKRDLIRAAALIMAELERIEREEVKACALAPLDRG